jgi:hypothetical protein
MPAYLNGPSLGPLHTVLWASGRRRVRGRRRRPRGPYWQNRFRRWTYWLSCLWVLEAYYWLGWLAVKGVLWAWSHRVQIMQTCRSLR